MSSVSAVVNLGNSWGNDFTVEAVLPSVTVELEKIFDVANTVDATCWVKVSKSGSVCVRGRFADGARISTSVKAEVGDGWIAAPATVRKVVKGQVKTFAFRVAFDEATRTVSAVNVASVVVADKKTLAVISETPVTAVEGGQPKLTKAAVKAMTFGVEGREAPAKSSVSTKFFAALRTYLAKQVEAGILTPAERKATRLSRIFTTP